MKLYVFEYLGFNLNLFEIIPPSALHQLPFSTEHNHPVSTMAELKDNGLPIVSRVITDHDETGKAIFSKKLPEPVVWQELADGARFSLGYATNQFPVELSHETDISTYNHYLQNLPGINIPGGTVLRYVDMMPGVTSPMHRTVSLDYGVVLEGEVELVLDSGEVRLLKRGHVAIQRGTNHAWRNASKTEWARMLYVLQEAKPLEIGGKKLAEDVADIPGYGDK